MNPLNETRLAWLFSALALGLAVYLFLPSPGLSDDRLGDMEQQVLAGEYLPLSELLLKPELAGKRLIEAELEQEHGRAVYELEILGSDGRVRERYFDAVTGEPLNHGD